MNRKEKLDICRMRLRGKSIYEIKEKIGGTHQAIWNFLRSFPEMSEEEKYGNIYSVITDYKSALAICRLFIDGVTVEEIAKKLDVDKESVLYVFDYIRSRKPPAMRQCTSKELGTWMQLTRCTVNSLADKIGAKPYILRNILAGRKNFTPEIVDAISDVTCIPIEKIVSGRAKEIGRR